MNLNLRNKAENYEDATLKCIFQLNNVYKISKLFADSQVQTTITTTPIKQQQKVMGKCRSLNELFAIAGKNNMKSFYDQEILTYKREYSKCWTKMLLFIKDLNDSNPFTDIKLKDKDRQVLKDRFSVGFNFYFSSLLLLLFWLNYLIIKLKGFNKEFEEIYETQKRYYIPVEQADLAKMLREDNCVYIIGQYKKFYDTYSKLNFATHREKYVKYSPELLAVRIREFFTAY